MKQLKRIQLKPRDARSERSDFFIYKSGYLSLADGSIWKGEMPKWQSDKYKGEVVFNTGMTGYVESLTDPSYAGQILVFTYPLIGNYGVDLRASESDKIQVSGVVVSEMARHWSHGSAENSLIQWLSKQSIPFFTGVDTRALTKHLRASGTMNGVIASKPMDNVDSDLIKHFVSISRPIVHKKDKPKKVILVDCGCKENILRSLSKFPICIKQVPYDYDYTKESYDGILFSNGPGDPIDYKSTISIAKRALKNDRPIFGICLGSQIMALAAGAKTYRLKFGHRGHNQPCLELKSKRGFITSQNHGYAIESQSLPKDWTVTFKNLNDDSIEGIKHNSRPFFSVQFHPEACPGPNDTEWLFKKFYEVL